MIRTIKTLIQKHFTSFLYFYSFLRYRILVSIALSLLVGALDGFGLAMFLPLLQMVDGQGSANGEQMGHLKFLVKGLNSIGINLNLTNVLVVMLSFFVLKGIAKYIEGYYKLVLQLEFIKKIRFSNVDLLSNYKYSAFVSNDFGTIQNTVSGEVEKVQQAYRNYFTTFQYAILVLVYITLAFLVNPKFAILVTIGGLMTNVFFKKLYAYTKDSSRKLTHELHGFQSLLIQMVANFKYLKASGLVFLFGDKLKESIDLSQETQRKIGVTANWLTAIREPAVMAVIVVVMLIQIKLFNEPLAALILSLLFFYRSLSFLMSLQNYWNSFLAVSGSLDNMKAFSKELSKNQVVHGGNVFNGFNDEIRLNKLSFNYGDKKILKNLSLEIKRNETIALVGESGSGKTTLVNILVGLLQVDKESYFVDNQDICSINLESFHNKIGYITQEPVIFNDTVFNNVTFWDSPTTENMEKFESALMKASIYDFIMEMPLKQNENLGDNGVVISGGQKQRLSIARELYKDIDILFMDEATSALDSQTEKEIQENIDQLKGQYTIFIIAHRLSTIKDADRIVYLDKGEIVAVGAFNDLKEKSESFKKLCALQQF